jgi:hypothetical protein
MADDNDTHDDDWTPPPGTIKRTCGICHKPFASRGPGSRPALAKGNPPSRARSPKGWS